MPNFADWLQLLAPPWLLDDGGRAMLSTIGQQLDRDRDLVRQGVMARFPEVAPPDALPEIGIDRSLPRAPYDTDASYGTYLRNAWETWGGDPIAGGGAGTPAGIIHALQRAGFPVTFAATSNPSGDMGATTVVSWNGRWAQIGADGFTPIFGELDVCPDRPGGAQTGWFDGASFASKFWVILFAAGGAIDGLSNDAGNVKKALLNSTVAAWNRAAATFGGTFVIGNPTWYSPVPGARRIRAHQHFLERLTGPQQYVLGWPPESIDPTNVIGANAKRAPGNSVLFIDPT